MIATKRSLIGRTIVDVVFRPFRHLEYPYKRCHDPALILDNGRRVYFATEETGGGEYGTRICITPKRKKVEA